MAKIDERRRMEWQERIARCKRSGLSVAEFCRKEDVPLHQYYYWVKQVPGKATKVKAVESVARDDNSFVRFELNSALTVSVPAHCIDAIHCILQFAQVPLPERAGTFRQVHVR